MSCIQITDTGIKPFYNDYLYIYICNGEIINNICQNSCMRILIADHLIIIVIFIILVIVILILTIIFRLNPHIMCCRCAICWKKYDKVIDYNTIN